MLSDAEVARLNGTAVVVAAPPKAPEAAPATGGAATTLVAGSKAPQVGYDDGFFVKTADGNWSLKLGG